MVTVTEQVGRLSEAACAILEAFEPDGADLSPADAYALEAACRLVREIHECVDFAKIHAENSRTD